MSPVFRRFFQLVVVLALVLAVGGHWAVLQSLAWMRMAVQYSRTVPLTVALQKTFDGRHPCKLCQVVKEGKKADQREVKKVEIKPDFFCDLDRAPVCPLAAFPAISSEPARLSSRGDSPPRPPPRVA